MRHVFMEDPNEDCFTAAKRRVTWAFNEFDTIIVSFSGGKDSTCTLQLALEEATRLNKLPLRVDMFDDEMLDPDTIAYTTWLSKREDILFSWFCMPILHTIRSDYRSHWITWDETQKDVWMRPMPEGAITVADYPSITVGMNISEAHEEVYKDRTELGKTGVMLGIRIEEAFNRRRSLIFSKGFVGNQKGLVKLKPIYDWKVRDVWKAIKENNWPYSKIYDKWWMKNYPLSQMRVAPWGNVAQVREIRFYQEFYPETWERAIRRMPELSAQARYGTSKLFLKAKAKPLNMTWQEYTYKLINEFDEEYVRKFWIKAIDGKLRGWARKYTIPFPEENSRIDGEIDINSWKRFAQIIAKNDLVKDKYGNYSCRDLN